MINIEYEFCGGNIINDERRRFKIKGAYDYEEIEPIISWQNLTYTGDMNMGATICGVIIEIYTKYANFCYFLLSIVFILKLG